MTKRGTDIQRLTIYRRPSLYSSHSDEIRADLYVDNPAGPMPRFINVTKWLKLESDPLGQADLLRVLFTFLGLDTEKVKLIIPLEEPVG